MTNYFSHGQPPSYQPTHFPHPQHGKPAATWSPAKPIVPPVLPFGHTVLGYMCPADYRNAPMAASVQYICKIMDGEAPTWRSRKGKWGKSAYSFPRTYFNPEFKPHEVNKGIQKNTFQNGKYWPRGTPSRQQSQTWPQGSNHGCCAPTHIQDSKLTRIGDNQ